MLKRTYIGEIDYFGVYCPDTGGVYLVPIAHASLKRMGSVRVDEPRNNQRRLIRLARDYELGQLTIEQGEGRRRWRCCA